MLTVLVIWGRRKEKCVQDVRSSISLAR